MPRRATRQCPLTSDASVGASGSLTVNASITGGFALTKAGSGTTMLTAVNGYTGDTTIVGGVFGIPNGLALGATNTYLGNTSIDVGA